MWQCIPLGSLRELLSPLLAPLPYSTFHLSSARFRGFNYFGSRHVSTMTHGAPTEEPSITTAGRQVASRNNNGCIATDSKHGASSSLAQRPPPGPVRLDGATSQHRHRPPNRYLDSSGKIIFPPLQELINLSPEDLEEFEMALLEVL